MPQRRQKIEPLDYLEMAEAPALRGMTSFLEITPQEASAAKNAELAASGLDRTPPVPIAFPQPLQGNVSSTGHVKTSGAVSSPGPPPPNRKQRPVGEQQRPRNLEYVSSPGHESPPVSVTSPEDDMSAGDHSTPGYETYAAAAIVPGRGRSKVRKCVLAQDGHSLGEEAVYQALWRAGRPESADPHAARVIRMGSAELAQRINMAKKNVRLNVARLFDKLSLEILEDFGTLTSKPRLYRVFSFKQILERRRSAGMEHVLRNKGVVFCTPDGEEMAISPAYVSSPGVNTLRPASPPQRRAVRNQKRSLTTSAPGNLDREDLAIVSRALSRYWQVDEAAAMQLITKCREVRADATAEEIALFTSDKLEMAVHSPRIKNPTGLILTAVPQCFEGASFETFRQQRSDQKRHEPAAKNGDLESTLTWMLLQLHPNDSKRQEVQVRLDQLKSARQPG